MQTTRIIGLVLAIFAGLAAALFTYYRVPVELLRSRLGRFAVSVGAAIASMFLVLMMHFHFFVLPEVLKEPSYPDGWRQSKDEMIQRIVELRGRVCFENDSDQRVIESLDFCRSRIRDADLSLLSGLDSLKLLWLTDTNVTDAGVAHLRGLKSITSLYLSNTHIGDGSLADIRSLPKIEVLDLSGTRITDDGLEKLAGLSTLRRLFLHETQIGSHGISHLQQLRGLEELSLCGCPIDDGSLDYLENMKSLKEVNVANTGISERGARQLQSCLPHCKIVR